MSHAFFVLSIVRSDIVVTQASTKVKATSTMSPVEELALSPSSSSLTRRSSNNFSFKPDAEKKQPVSLDLGEFAASLDAQSESQPDKKETLSRKEVDLINFFCKPIEFTPDGISYYFKYVYNHPEYVHYLPYSFSHMIQFLEYGTKSGQSEVFAASIVKMFLQKIKAVSYVEAEAFAEFVPKLTQAMKPYLEKKEASFLNEMQVVLKEKLSSIFAKYFSHFQKSPDSFMNSLAEQIAKQTNQSVTKQHVEIAQLKKDVLRFLEMCANKLVWSSKDDLQVWYTCNRLAHECQLCLDQNVLCNTDALDDICWSLIHRFCYFVELSSGSLNKNFYAQVLHDLQTKPLTLVSLEEQEDLMTTKKSHLIMRMQACKDLCGSMNFDMTGMN